MKNALQKQQSIDKIKEAIQILIDKGVKKITNDKIVAISGLCLRTVERHRHKKTSENRLMPSNNLLIDELFATDEPEATNEVAVQEITITIKLIINA